MSDHLIEREEWAERVLAISPPGGSDLLDHLAALRGRPGQRWTRTTREMLAARPELLEFAHGMVAVFVEMLEQGEKPYRDEHGQVVMAPWREQLDMSGNDAVLRAAIWALGVAGPPWAAELLARAGVCGRFVTNEPGNLLNIATSAVRALGEIGAAEQLARLQSRITHRTVLKAIGPALDDACARRGLTLDEVRESAVDDVGLEADGRRAFEIGEARAVLQVHPTRVELTWVQAGRERRTVPVGLRTAHKLEVDDVRRVVKEVRALLATERDRLDSLLLKGLSRSLDQWVPSYAEHPLVGVLARSLVWFVDGRAALPAAAPGRFTTLEGDFEPRPTATVELLHPLRLPDDELRAWQRVVTGEQTVAQLFRETFRPDAEEADSTRSFRFARKTVDYDRAHALLQSRGWTLPFQGPWDRDGSFEAVREFGPVRAAWFIEDRAAEPEGGMMQLALTGAVTFSHAGVPVAMTDVDPVVLSEILRDLSLVTAGSPGPIPAPRPPL